MDTGPNLTHAAWRNLRLQCRLKKPVALRLGGKRQQLCCGVGFTSLAPGRFSMLMSSCDAQARDRQHVTGTWYFQLANLIKGRIAWPHMRSADGARVRDVRVMALCSSLACSLQCATQHRQAYRIVYLWGHIP